MPKKHKPLFDPKKGPNKDEEYMRCVQGDMTYFPLCCSTGILQNFSTRQYKPSDWKTTHKDPLALSPDALAKVQESKYIDNIIRAATRSSSMVAPMYFARWYAMSLIYRKVVHGHDKHGKGAYSGYKAAQISMFDRLLEDKDPAKGFKYSYNMVYAVSHLMEWLKENGDKYGEVLVSKPVPGAHGARVYGCIFTPDPALIKKYHDERLEVVRGHYLALHEAFKKKAPKVEAATKGLPNFVSY